MLGSTPPAAMVTVPSSLDSSSSLRMASWMWRGMMLRRIARQRRAAAGPGQSGNAPGLLVVAGSVASQLQHLGGEVLEHGRQVDGGARAHAGRELAGLQEAGWGRRRGERGAGGGNGLSGESRRRGKLPRTARARATLARRAGAAGQRLGGRRTDAAHGELQASLGAAAHGLLGGLSLSTAGHCEELRLGELGLEKSNTPTRELAFLERGGERGPSGPPRRAAQCGGAAQALGQPSVAPCARNGNSRAFRVSIRLTPALPNLTMAPKKADKKPAAKTTKPAAAKKGRKKTKARRAAHAAPRAHAHGGRRSSPTRSTSTRC